MSVTETMEVTQDNIVASLKIEYQDSDPKILQKNINKIMKKASEYIDSQNKNIGSSHNNNYSNHIDASTYSYSVYKKYDSNKWIGSQSIKIKGRNKEQILEIVRKLQDIGMTITNLNY
ncbi:MAG TPA: SIMPL domain-containing protein, partial [Candidatus Megaira endosymbiont of Hartmannula sinica]|nr:SIMPL domain-containing protein [Candidatus Megaera endosymbiont of Hartmannula sinica]